tara:strand:- start:10130 stop:11818 length:1689 start_codon:yes stop_codon:yes gene_type:complete
MFFINFFKRFIKILNQINDVKFSNVLAAQILRSIFELFGIGLIYPYMNYVITPYKIYENKYSMSIYENLNFSSENEFLFAMGFLLIIIFCLNSLVSALSKIYCDKYIWNTNSNLISIAFKRAINAKIENYKRQNINKITHNIIAEVRVFVNILMVPTFDFLSRFFLIVFITTLLMFINVKITLIALVLGLIIYWLVYIFFRKKLSQMSKKRLDLEQSIFEYVINSLRSIKDIKVNNLEEYYIEKVKTPAKHFSFLNQEISIYASMPKYLVEALVFSITILVLILNIEKESIIDLIPSVSIFGIAIFKLLPIFQGIYANITRIKFNFSAMEVIEDHIANIKSEKVKKVEYLKFKSFELKNINFKYDENNKILDNFNLRLNSGDFLLIKGESGSGKSTLVEVILGLIKPRSGKIMLNGKTLINNFNLSSNIKVGYVSQDIFIFEGTLIENIIIPNNKRERYSKVDLKKVIEICKLDSIINSLGGLEGKISDGGKNLSAGQRQRIAIARSIINFPDLLIFDEATSALDIKTENHIINSIKKMKKTIVMISHNKSINKFSNNIIEL